MDIGSFLGGRYLGAVDLPQAYQTWTIQAVGQEVVDGQPRIYVKFFEHQKPYLANKTNLTSLAQGLGRESQNWINQRVEVTRQPTTFQGRACEGIRLRIPPPSQGYQQPPAPQPMAQQPQPVAPQQPQQLQPQGAWQPPTQQPQQAWQPAQQPAGQPPQSAQQQQPSGVVSSPGAPAWGAAP